MKTFSIKNRCILVLCIILMASHSLIAQDYSRKSLTVMMLKYNDDKPISSNYFYNIYVPKRFDQNNIGINSLNINSYFSNAENINESDIRRLIRANKIPNKILRSILIDDKAQHMSIRPTNYMSVDFLKFWG